MSTTSEIVERLRKRTIALEHPLHREVFQYVASPLCTEAADRLDELERENARLRQPEWFYHALDGETGAADIESIIDDMDMNGVMQVCGARQVWRKWVARKCLTVDSGGEPDEVSYETFETPEEAERCWPESLSKARAALAGSGEK
jgi:hypothetical protein